MIFCKYFFLFFFFLCKKECLDTKLKTEKELLNKVEAEVKQRKVKCMENNKETLKNNRSSHRRCFVRKGVPGNFTKFTEKHLCQSFFK